MRGQKGRRTDVLLRAQGREDGRHESGESRKQPRQVIAEMRTPLPQSTTAMSCVWA